MGDKRSNSQETPKNILPQIMLLAAWGVGGSTKSERKMEEEWNKNRHRSYVLGWKEGSRLKTTVKERERNFTL